MTLIRTFFAAVAVLGAAATLPGTARAAAGFIALEGSDATALHQDPVYTPQLFQYLAGGSAASVLVYNPNGTVAISHPGTASLSYATSLAGLTLGDYSAIYIESPGGCCTANNTALDGFGAAVAAFIGHGGNLSIENYVGGTYDGVVPGGANPTGAILTGCSDGEITNANGMSKGFSQPPVDYCWSHQAYENSYWLAQGYNSLIDSTMTFGTFADGTHIGSSLLATGGTLGAPVPEPASLVLLGAGLTGLGWVRRRRA